MRQAFVCGVGGSAPAGVDPYVCAFLGVPVCVFTGEFEGVAYGSLMDNCGFS